MFTKSSLGFAWIIGAAAAMCIGDLAAAPGSVSGAVPLPPRQPGKIAVEKYTGAISGKVSNPPPQVAGVWLEGNGAKPDRTTGKTTLAQQGYQFAASLIVVSLGSQVEFPNKDQDYHNIYSLSRTKRFDLGRYKKDETPAPVVTFDKPGLVRLKCEIHDHMNAAVLVVDSRWHTVTDTAGRFKLGGIPPGSYILHAQLDERTRWSAPVTIHPGKNTAADFADSSP